MTRVIMVVIFMGLVTILVADTSIVKEEGEYQALVEAPWKRQREEVRRPLEERTDVNSQNIRCYIAPIVAFAEKSVEAVKQLWSKLDSFWERLVVVSGILALVWEFIKLVRKIMNVLSETRLYDIYLARYTVRISRFINGPRIQMRAHGPIAAGRRDRQYFIAQVLLSNKSLILPAILPTKALSNAKVYVQFFNNNRQPIFDEMLMANITTLPRYSEVPVNIAGSMNDGNFFIFGSGLFLDGDHRRVLIPNHEGIANAYPLSFSPACLSYGEHLVRIRVSADNSDILEWFRVYRDEDPDTFSIS